ncbi:MAG: EI24 domain-containing protein [Rhodospirillaceae bacterium]|nr:EI24 domain-containing protein [Rhodospirillaceae bacterium]
MIKAFVKACAQVSDPAARRVVLLSIGAAVMVFILLWVAIGFLLTSTSLFALGWLETAIDLLGGLATGVLTWLLFPAVITTVIGLFLEDIAAIVEARHYPDLSPAIAAPIMDTVLTTLKFLGVLIAVNLMVLPFLLTGPLFPFVFYAANGYLLSREYFELVALRRLGAAEARTLRKAHQMTLFISGVVIALMLTVPVVNLLAPIIATAMMVHLFEGWRAST